MNMNDGMLGGAPRMQPQYQQPFQQQQQPPHPQQMMPGSMGLPPQQQFPQQGIPQQSAPPQPQPQQQQSQQFPVGAGGGGAGMPNKPLQPPTPQSNPELDSKRVTLILDINLELLRHVMSVYKEDRPANEQDPSYFNCMKRLQCNLAYLASLADKSKALPQAPHCPQILSPPQDVPALVEPYRKLQQLFPEVMAYMQQQMALRQQQQQQQQQQMAQRPTQFMG
jgi:hypothetical protein